MKVEEAKKILEVTPEDKSAIQKYLGFNYANVNVLGNFTIETYNMLESSGGSRKLPENAEEFRQAIEEFARIYEIIYKESKGKNIDKNNILIRGSSAGYVLDNSHFLSTSRRVEVAKRFRSSDYGVLIDYELTDGVPFLDVSAYKEEISANEQEVIIAPFCEMVENTNRVYYYNGSPEYNVTVKKGTLKEMSSEDIEKLQAELISSFKQNLSDIIEAGKIQDDLKFRGEENDRPEDIGNSYDVMRRLTQRKLDEATLSYRRAKFENLPEAEKQSYLDEVNYLKERLEEITVQENNARSTLNSMRKSTNEFAKKLGILLQGLCRKKELEIDKAYETVRKQEMITGLSDKMPEGDINAETIQSAVSKTYQDLLDSEKDFIRLANALGIKFTKTISDTGLNRSVNEVKSNIENIQRLIDESNLKPEDSYEDVSKELEQTMPLLDGMSDSMSDVADFHDIVRTYNIQADTAIKKGLFERVHRTIKNAQIAKLSQEKEALESRKIGFFGRLVGRDILRDEKIRNLELKIKLAQNEAPEERKKYSARDILADMYVYAITELGGEFTPEMSAVSKAIKATYRDKAAGAFSEEYITSLAKKKIQDDKLKYPAPIKRQPLFFGKTKAKLENLRAENSELQNAVARATMTSSSMDYLRQENDDALSIFEQKLKVIAARTHDKTKDIGRGQVQETSLEG